MKQLYEKNELTFALVWIGIYCGIQSLANPLSDAIGMGYSAHILLNILMTGILVAFLWKNQLLVRYGLCTSAIPAKRLLWYLPLVVVSSTNLWNGTTLNMPWPETICYLGTMLCVGFLEEVIFRGFLFRAMANDNVKSAILVSCITFGIGHVMNLFNGSGMDLVSNLFQVVSAIFIGLLYVMVFYRSGTLIPCILSHSAINMLSAFAKEAGLPIGRRIVCNLILVAICSAYSLYLAQHERPASNTSIE